MANDDKQMTRFAAVAAEVSGVKVDRTDHEGWRYFNGQVRSEPHPTYPEAVRAALAAGLEVDNAGWRRRLLMWQFNSHALDGYPEWEIEREGSPAFAKLTHVRGQGETSHALAAAWDDVALVDFYQRNWTSDGIPFVRDGETYWSGWWFASVAERDRFLEWCAARGATVTS